jgi:hypothetical protein
MPRGPTSGERPKGATCPGGGPRQRQGTHAKTHTDACAQTPQTMLILLQAERKPPWLPWVKRPEVMALVGRNIPTQAKQLSQSHKS